VKTYLGKQTFKITDFPLMVSYAHQKGAMPPHYHDFTEIVLVSHGHSIHNIHNVDTNQELSYGLIQGDAFSVMPGEVHKYSKSKHFIIYNLAFDKKLIDNEIKMLSALPSWSVLFNSNPSKVRSKIHLLLSEHLTAEKYLKRIILELSLKKPGFKLSAKTALLNFLIITARANAIEWKVAADVNSTRLLSSINHMKESTNKPFNLETFAQIAGMSISSYTRKFRESTGLSPLEYFIGMRLEKVRWLLAETDLPLSEIAFQCGFCDANYMIKIFRIRQGITPAKYRKIVR
jgi:AraC-like DNA-binding protein